MIWSLIRPCLQEIQSIYIVHLLDMIFVSSPYLVEEFELTGTAGGHPVDAPPRYGSIISEITVHSN